jgi:hypothetical protein
MKRSIFGSLLEKREINSLEYWNMLRLIFSFRFLMSTCSTSFDCFIFERNVVWIGLLKGIKCIRSPRKNTLFTFQRVQVSTKGKEATSSNFGDFGIGC